MSFAIQPDPILRVTVGSPVYTSDGEKIGTVKERQSSAFKVGTPFLQRDYWLSADHVASATPDAEVTLSVEKAHLNELKLKSPPAAA